MKKYSKLLFIVASAATIVSCQNTVYKKWDNTTLKNNLWSTGQKLVFDPKIEDSGRTYSITIGIRHFHGLDLHEIAVSLSFISPSGDLDMKTYTLPIKDSQGDYLASCSGSYCDLETEVETSYQFKETGQYKIIIQQITPFENLIGIMEVGLIIR
jgi:gliding motility-associated lipoprotein GldH